MSTNLRARARSIAPTVAKVQIRAASQPGKWNRVLVLRQFGQAATDAFSLHQAKSLAAHINITGQVPAWLSVEPV